jgi:hypothetical protein
MGSLRTAWTMLLRGQEMVTNQICKIILNLQLTDLWIWIWIWICSPVTSGPSEDELHGQGDQDSEGESRKVDPARRRMAIREPGTTQAEECMEGRMHGRNSLGVLPTTNMRNILPLGWP